MDSLGRLADNLPRHSSSTASLALAEAELTSAFKSSALAITQLLKASQKTSKKAYQAGYATALADVLEYLQQNLDVQQPASTAEGTAIAQAIDYIEARQEAVRLQGLEADGEDEQQEQQHTVHRPVQRPARSRQSSEQGSLQSLRLPGGPAPLNGSTTAQQSKQVRQPQASTSRLPAAGPSQLQTLPSRAGRAGSAPLQAEATSHRPTSTSIQSEEALSSSLPNSPDFRSASNSTDHFTFSCPPTSEHATSEPPNAASVGGGAHSPLTRLQVRRERERHHDGRRRGQQHQQPGPSTIGTKRRWTASLLPEWNAVLGMPPSAGSEHSINLEDEQSVPPEQDEEIPSDGEVVGHAEEGDVRQQDKQDVDMDAIGDTYRNDGSTRPVKRVVRR